MRYKEKDVYYTYLECCNGIKTVQSNPSYSYNNIVRFDFAKMSKKINDMDNLINDMLRLYDDCEHFYKSINVENSEFIGYIVLLQALSGSVNWTTYDCSTVPPRSIFLSAFELSNSSSLYKMSTIEYMENANKCLIGLSKLHDKVSQSNDEILSQLPKSIDLLISIVSDEISRVKNIVDNPFNTVLASESVVVLNELKNINKELELINEGMVSGIWEVIKSFFEGLLGTASKVGTTAKEVKEKSSKYRSALGKYTSDTIYVNSVSQDKQNESNQASSIIKLTRYDEGMTICKGIQSYVNSKMANIKSLNGELSMFSSIDSLESLSNSHTTSNIEKFNNEFFNKDKGDKHVLVYQSEILSRCKIPENNETKGKKIDAILNNQLKVENIKDLGNTTNIGKLLKYHDDLTNFMDKYDDFIHQAELFTKQIPKINSINDHLEKAKSLLDELEATARKEEEEHDKKSQAENDKEKSESDKSDSSSSNSSSSSNTPSKENKDDKDKDSGEIKVGGISSTNTQEKKGFFSKFRKSNNNNDSKDNKEE